MGTVPGHSRKILVLACYIPPGDNAQRGNACLEFIEDLIIHLKRKYSNPFIVTGGDFNQWKIEDVMADFPDLSEAEVGPTKGNHSIDQTFTNFGMITDAGTVQITISGWSGTNKPFGTFSENFYCMDGVLSLVITWTGFFVIFDSQKYLFFHSETPCK